MEHTTNNERANESIGRSMDRYEARRQPTTNTTSSQLFTGSIENAVRWVSGNHFAHLLTRVGGWLVGWDGALFFSVSQKLALSVTTACVLKQGTSRRYQYWLRGTFRYKLFPHGGIERPPLGKMRHRYFFMENLHPRSLNDKRQLIDEDRCDTYQLAISYYSSATSSSLSTTTPVASRIEFVTKCFRFPMKF